MDGERRPPGRPTALRFRARLVIASWLTLIVLVVYLLALLIKEQEIAVEANRRAESALTILRDENRAIQAKLEEVFEAALRAEQAGHKGQVEKIITQVQTLPQDVVQAALQAAVQKVYGPATTTSSPPTTTSSSTSTTRPATTTTTAPVPASTTTTSTTRPCALTLLGIRLLC